MVPLPQMEQEECIQIQSIVAWSLQYDTSTWFADEQSSNYILKSLDIT
jgi:hypothetical protein